MLLGRASPSANPNALRKQFRLALQPLWRKGGSRPRLGLAISGGVDSMALASLCSEIAKVKGHRPSFTGFIVDHQLREGSKDEAQHVAERLRGLNIRPTILTLDWTKHGDPQSLSNLESVARRLRYQALGRACREQGIESLLVAHHADDQAETVMMRLLGGYLGFGLCGVKSVRPIPDCGGLYGINQSGEPNPLKRQSTSGPKTESRCMRVEGGGINITRPLLSFPKAQLIEHCREVGVEWFEDHTNADRTHTLRNTVRYLLQSDALPSALRKPRLLALASSVAERESNARLLAQHVFDQTTVRLNIHTGSALVEIPDLSAFLVDSPKESYSVKAVLLQKLLSLLAPTDDVPLQDLHNAIDFVFPDLDSLASSRLINADSVSCQVSGVAITRAAKSVPCHYALQRSLPSRRESAGQVSTLFASEQTYDQVSELFWASDWHLWDSRYWLRINCSRAHLHAGCGVQVRFLTSGDVATLRHSVSTLRCQRLNRLLAAAPGSSRFTLPAIVVRSPPATALDADPQEQVVALPTLGWSAEAWQQWPGDESDAGSDPSCCFWDVRYKHIDFAPNEKHTSVAPQAMVKARTVAKARQVNERASRVVES